MNGLDRVVVVDDDDDVVDDDDGVVVGDVGVDGVVVGLLLLGLSVG